MKNVTAVFLTAGNPPGESMQAITPAEMPTGARFDPNLGAFPLGTLTPPPTHRIWDRFEPVAAAPREAQQAQILASRSNRGETMFTRRKASCAMIGRSRSCLSFLRTLRIAGAAAASLYVSAIASFSYTTVQAAEAPTVTGGSPGFRRLNEAQYVRSIEQIFGPGINVPGRFDPPMRQQGLLAIGDAKVTVSASGIEQYELRAREIAAQVVKGGKAKVPCQPSSPDAFDAACASQFFAKYGRLLYRRPLSEAELSLVVGIAEKAARTNHSFSNGLEVGLSRLLVSPYFIFRVERSTTYPEVPGVQRLDDYSLATRISFLLWNAPPDTELLDAATRGDLRNSDQLQKQVDRMMASPRFEQGVRAFFSDMFGYEQFEGLSKDQKIYPKFSSELVRDAKEQTLRTIVDLLVVNRGDYRELFTTKRTFITRQLGALYKVPVSTAALDGWAPYTFPADEPRGGILSLAAFLMLDPTHEGRSSPTIRGKTVRELLLCQPIPQPPPNVNFSLVQDVSNPLYQTARQRLTVHQENPVCAGCHARTDPIGLSIENYDAIGNYRTHENSALIDASGTFDRKPYVGLLELSKVLSESPKVPSCLVQRTFEYAVGREAGTDDARWIENAVELFASDGYRFPALMRQIATSQALVAVKPVTQQAVSMAPTQQHFTRRTQ